MSEPPLAKRERIGVSLMSSAETEAAVSWLQDHHPEASVKFRDCYFKIERDHELIFDLAGISKYLGRELDTETFLVNLSSYYGRILIEGNVIRIVSEIATA